MDHIFSWQANDYERLMKAFEADSKIVFIHGRDFESPYHVLASFCTYLSEQEYSVLEINAVSPNLSYPFLPFTQAAKQVQTKRQTSKPLLPSLIKDITHSDTLATLAENIGSYQRVQNTLSAFEIELLAQLEYLITGESSVFLFRQYAYYDMNSQKFAALLASGLLNDDFPFLQRARFMFICEAEDTSAAFQNVKELEHMDIFLSDPQKDDMDEILAEISPKLHLTPEDRDKLFYLSGGRLSVMDILARHLSNGQGFADGSTQDVINATLSERISFMGESKERLENILEYAANIGDTFYIPLLKQVADPSDCDWALQKSEQEYFTKCSHDSGAFVCREIRNYFYSCPDASQKRNIAYLLEGAIYYFDPYDYLTRAHYMEQAEQLQDACELYFLAYNSISQEGIVPSRDLQAKIDQLSAQCGLEAYWVSLCNIYTFMVRHNYEKCVEILEEMPDAFTPRLLLLKEYLLGLCLQRQGNTFEQRQEAIATMHAAVDHAKDIEEGLWCDCQMVLLSFLVNIGGHITEARQICKELTYFYTQKYHAPFAEKGLHALERKWNALYSVERAVLKTEKSVDYFRNGLYPSQYLMALNNHSANLIISGNFEEAMKYLEEAVNALRGFRAVGINQMYLLSNYCLCAVLSKMISPEKAYKMLDKIIAKEAFGDWMIIFRLNSAIYIALAGEIRQSEEKLRALEKECRELQDDYYQFYIHANLAAVLYLQGRRTEAIELLREKCSAPPSLCKATERDYLKKRTQRWIAVMESVKIQDPYVFDTYLLHEHPARTQWAFIGRGFLYSDIQFWSEP